MPVGRWFDVLLRWVVPAQFLILISWWLYQAAVSEPEWWNPISSFSLGTCLLQWGAVFAVFWLLNDRIAAATLDPEEP